MRLPKVFSLVAVLALVGCANHPSGTQNNVQPQQAAQTQENAAPPANMAETAPPSESSSDVVRAPSPFGSREPVGERDSPVAAAAVREQPEQALIPRGTTLRVRLAHAVDTASSRPGQHFTATLDTPILSGAHVAVPKGTTFTGHLTAAKSSGRLRGRAVLGLTLDSFELNGRSYPVSTSSVSRASANHKKRNLGLIGGGSGLGAVLGAIAGGGKGALIGAGAGAAAGTAGAAVTGKRNVRLPAETPLAFTLQRPVTL